MCSSSLYKLPFPFTLTQTHHNPTRITLPTRPIKLRASDGSRSVTFSPPDPNPTLYQVLGISENVTLGEIKKAYKEMARKYHPDVSPPGRAEEYTERFIRVQEAYETLSDPETRASYDGNLGFGLHIAFSSRRRYNDDLEMEDKGEWRNRWQNQLSELKLRSENKNSRESMSWGARVRRQNSDS